MVSRHESFRRAVRDIALIARREIGFLLGPYPDPRDATRILEEILPELIRQYGLAASTVAAEYYDAVRDEAMVTGGFRALPQEPAAGGTDSLIHWALGQATSPEAFYGLLMGGLQRRIANASRETVMRSAVADPRAQGWMRIGVGHCGFCAMLIGRGAVYRSESTVSFAAHDDCNCNYAPAFNERQAESVLKEFVPSARRRSEETRSTDNARSRRWIEANL